MGVTLSTPEILLALLLALLAALLWSLVFSPVHLTLRLEAGKGMKPEWALGLGWSIFDLSVEQGKTPPGHLTFFLFKRKIFSITLSAPKEKQEEPEAGEKSGGGMSKTLSALERIDRHLGFAEILGFLINERRRMAIDDLSGRIRYGFDDYARTGLVNGYIWAIQGAVGPAFRLQHEPDWSGKNVFAGGLRLRMRLYPALMLIDIVLFAVTRVRLAAPRGKLRALSEYVERREP